MYPNIDRVSSIQWFGPSVCVSHSGTVGASLPMGEALKKPIWVQTSVLNPHARCPSRTRAGELSKKQAMLEVGGNSKVIVG